MFTNPATDAFLRRKTDYSEFIKFIKTLSDIELVLLQCESRKFNDTETVDCILKELNNRAKNKIGK